MTSRRPAQRLAGCGRVVTMAMRSRHLSRPELGPPETWREEEDPGAPRRSIAAFGLEGALGEAGSGGTACEGSGFRRAHCPAGATDPRLGLSPGLPWAQPAPACQACMDAVAGTVSSLLERMTLRSVRHLPL